MYKLPNGHFRICHCHRNASESRNSHGLGPPLGNRNGLLAMVKSEKGFVNFRRNPMNFGLVRQKNWVMSSWVI